MTPAGRPDAVRRFVTRPLWWVLVAAVAVAWSHLDDVASSRARDRALDTGPRATGEVGDDYDGSGVVPVTFEHPEWGRIVTAFHLNDLDRAPEAGDRIALDISVDDPTDVALAGDRHRATDYLGFDLGLVAIPVVFFAARWIGDRRARRLMGASGPSFSMLGLVRSAGRLRPRAVLDLSPLDAPAGSPPLCSLPLLHTGALPLERAYAVEIKGSPRPLGRIVARAADGTLLWPRGRASPTRAEGRYPPPPIRPPQRPAPGPGPRTTLAWSPLWRTFPPVLGFALAGAAAFGIMVTMVVAANGSVAARADGSPGVVLGTVVAADAGIGEVTIEHQDRETTLVVDEPDRLPEGGTAALRIDPADETNVRLASEPYDMIEPLVWGWLPAAAVVAVCLSWLVVTRRNRRAALDGWRSVDGWSVTGESGGHRLALAFPDAPSASCLMRIPPGPARRVHGEHVLVAGSMAPGDPVAIRLGDRALPGVWVAEAAGDPSAVDRPVTGGG